MSKVRGVMTCLMINDIDAGLAHFKNTQVDSRRYLPLEVGAGNMVCNPSIPWCSCMIPPQVTVNNQLVIGTLMNICDGLLYHSPSPRE